MTTIERAARALHKLYTEEKERTGATGMPSWDELGEDGVFYFTHHARAVLQAIREPSEGMLRAGATAFEWYHESFDQEGLCGKIHIAMIDAALAE